MNEQDYGEEYFLCHCGLPYTRDEPHWAKFFGSVAEKIDQILAPRTVFDAGCAIGFLVEALRARGVEAFGRDLSSYAIEQVPIGLKPYCHVGSIAEPIEGTFDLVTCIEVVEHMPEEAAREAVANLCRAASQVLFSSSPTDYTEVTHINVHPPLYWMKLFAEHGFGPRADFDGTFLCPWATLFERRETPPGLPELEAQARLVMVRTQAAAAGSAREGELREQLRQMQGLLETLRAELTALSESAVPVVVVDEPPEGSQPGAVAPDTLFQVVGPDDGAPDDGAMVAQSGAVNGAQDLASQGATTGGKDAGVADEEAADLGVPPNSGEAPEASRPAAGETAMATSAVEPAGSRREDGQEIPPPDGATALYDGARASRTDPGRVPPIISGEIVQSSVEVSQNTPPDDGPQDKPSFDGVPAMVAASARRSSADPSSTEPPDGTPRRGTSVHERYAPGAAGAQASASGASTSQVSASQASPSQTAMSQTSAPQTSAPQTSAPQTSASTASTSTAPIDSSSAAPEAGAARRQSWPARLLRLRPRRRRDRSAPVAAVPQLSEEEALIERSGLFDANWYRKKNPDIAGFTAGPLKHFIQYGVADGRDPNAFFSTTFYSKHPEVAESGMNPLLHYIQFGSEAGLRPSPEFDPHWYRDNYIDIAGFEPLRHYLWHGSGEGRRRNEFDLSRDITETYVQVVKKPEPAAELVLFVTHAPGGRIKPHVPVYLDALKQVGLSTILIIASDELDEVETSTVEPLVDGLLVRANEGWDFAAWAHALRFVDLAPTRLLCLANDSLIGPFSVEGLRAIMDRARQSPAQIIGLTDNYEFKRHLQSYFLIGRDEGVAGIAEFLSQVRSLISKQDVIYSYEIQLLAAMNAKGLTAEALFPSRGTTNRTLTDWRKLIDEGFPFLKAAVPQMPHVYGWQQAIAAQGYDASIAERSLKIIRSGRPPKLSEVETEDLRQQFQTLEASLRSALVWTTAERDAAMDRLSRTETLLLTARKRPWKQVRNKLKFKFYKTLADAVRSVSPKNAKSFERRARKHDPRSLPTPLSVGNYSDQPSMNTPIVFEQLPMSEPNVIRGRRPIETGRKNVLVVSHQANRSGAPILALNIAEHLSDRYNVTCLCLNGGDLIDDFRDVCVSVVDANQSSSDPTVYRDMIFDMCGETPFEFAVVNSIQSEPVLQAIYENGVPSVALLHEFASYISNKRAFPYAVRWSSETVFSANLTLESALEAEVPDYSPRIHVIPQGKCRVPVGDVPEDLVRKEERRLRATLRPLGTGDDSFVVLGAGTVEMRKGVDLFIETAAHALKAPGGEKLRFVWIGAGYRPDDDLAYSVYLRDQLRRSGVEDRVSIIPQTPEIELAYELSDVLLVSSRLDPLPNVAIDAMSVGLPVLCFDKATGMADLLKQATLGADCVADYGDTHQLARRIVALAASREDYTRVSQATRSFAATAFDMGAYIRKIEGLGLLARTRQANLPRDIEIIEESGFFRPDFLNRDKEDAGHYVRRLEHVAMSRKPEPGFHPYIYAQAPGTPYDITRDPYADFLSKGRPEGPWLLPVLEGRARETRSLPAPTLRTALHIHAFFTDELNDMLERLQLNKARPDLFISVADAEGAREAETILAAYEGRVAAVEEVPNAGRDIGPLLTQFGPRLVADYEVIGHLHVKRSGHIQARDVVRIWSEFLMENLLGGQVSGRMLDLILKCAQDDPKVGLIYPSDPHLVGWTRNLPIARDLAVRLGHETLPPAINFPVGTMFWMRGGVLKRFVDLDLKWPDYPTEPLGGDGTMLHALERLFGVVPALEGWKSVVTNVRGITR